MKNKVIGKYDPITELPEISLTDLCGDSLEPAEPYAYLEGGSLPTDISLLRTLAKNIKDCHYFEIGTWRGESAANVARVAEEVVTVNLSPEEIIKLGGSEEYARAHFFFSKNQPNIRQLLCSTRDLDFKAFNRKFDLVFIDGDHHYDMICHDTRKVFNDLAHDSTVVVWHDYGLNPEMVRYEVLLGILDSVPREKHRRLYHVSNTLCAIYLPYEMKSTLQSYPRQPEGWFRVDLTWKEK